MIHVLCRQGAIGQQPVRSQLADIPRNSRLFDQIFLKKVSQLVIKYLIDVNALPCGPSSRMAGC
jgi:hypothetical protein